MKCKFFKICQEYSNPNCKNCIIPKIKKDLKRKENRNGKKN
jgi:hypothetical protein